MASSPSVSRCCFCCVKSPRAEISFASHFTRFLNKENGQAAFLSPRSPTFSMGMSSDNTPTTRGAWGWPSQAAGRLLSSQRVLKALGAGLQRRATARGPRGGEPPTLLFTIGRNSSPPPFPPPPCLSEPRRDEVETCVTTTRPH